MARKLACGFAVFLAVAVCCGFLLNDAAADDGSDKIKRVETEIPRYSDPNPFAVLLFSFNNMLNPQKTRELPRTSLDSLMAEYKIPGVCVGVIEDYGVEWIKGYGKIHAERDIEVTPETYFEAGSMMKLFSIACQGCDAPRLGTATMTRFWTRGSMSASLSEEMKLSR